MSGKRRSTILIPFRRQYPSYLGDAIATWKVNGEYVAGAEPRTASHTLRNGPRMNHQLGQLELILPSVLLDD